MFLSSKRAREMTKIAADLVVGVNLCHLDFLK